MKRIINKFKELSLVKRVQFIIAALLTAGLIAAMPVYAWFTSQKKAAEMYKVQFPNTLYINAAHREDQMYFNLDGININGYAKDPITGQPILDQSNEKVKVDRYRYVFAVSGSNTTNFTLQMAHTTNNLFTYTIYEADQYTGCTEVEKEGAVTGYTLTGLTLSGTSKTETIGAAYKDRVVVYQQHRNSHTENQLQVIGDSYVDSADTDLFYLRGALPIEGENYKNKSGSLAVKSKEDTYYSKTYGNNTNVESHAVPLYWQKSFDVNSDNNKNFCKYFVLEVTWNEDEQANQTKKETDMIYFSVKRS